MLIKQKTEKIPHCSWLNCLMFCWITLICKFTLYSISVAYLENVVNICIINDLYYSPANNQNAFFYYPTHPTRGSSAAPADITVIRASLIAGILADIIWCLTSYFKDPDIYKLILIPNITLNISAFLLFILLNIHIYWVIPIWPQKHCIPKVVTQWNPKPGVNGSLPKSTALPHTSASWFWPHYFTCERLIHVACPNDYD